MTILAWALVLSFASWRAASLLYGEPTFKWLRKRIGIDTIENEHGEDEMTYPDTHLGDLWSCFWCLSLCVALYLSTVTGIVIGLNIWECFLLWMASAAGALWVERRIGVSKKARW